MSGQSSSSSSQTYTGADTAAPTNNGATTNVVRSTPHGHVLTACLIAVNVAVVALIYLYFWRFFFRKRSVAGDDDDEEDASSTSPASTPGPSPLRNQQQYAHDRIMASLPTFVMRAGEKQGPAEECAVCIAELRDGDEARALPRCSHRFHAACVDAWLRTTPSCPLCRAAVALPHPSLSAMLAAAQQQQQQETRTRGERSRSFVVEIGTVSNRASSPLAAGGGGNSRNSRTYSLGSFDYQIDEEVEAVLSRVARPTIRDVIIKEEKPGVEDDEAEAPSPPGETVAEAAGSSRGWLREYVDRLASTAYTFGRWSSRQSHQTQNVRQEEPWLWDAEAAAEMSSAPGSDEEETAFMVLYRWIAGV